MAPVVRFLSICMLLWVEVVSADTLVVDLPGGNLREALLLFGQQTQTSVFFAEETVAGIEIAPLSGSFSSPGAAISSLLADTCLEFDFIRERFVTIAERSACAERSEPASAPVPEPREPPAPVAPIEEILVSERYLTGSRLRQPAYGEAMPVDVIDASEIRLSGLQSVGEILRYIPAVSGNSTSTLISNGGDGTATVTLRGLPATNTLVLLNGRRLNSNALNGASVDLNTLPLSMVEQIEILKDGVSAVYGSDAVAGVVNVITREGISGISLDYYRGESRHGDLETEQISVSYGWHGDRGSIAVGANFYDQSGVFSRDRHLSASSNDLIRGGIDKRSSATTPAYVGTGAGGLILGDGLSGDSANDYRPVSADDRFEYRDYTSTIVPSTRYGLFAQGKWHQSNRLEFELSSLWQRTEADAHLAPVPIFTGFESVPLSLSADHPHNPFGVELLDIRRRITELPPRRQLNTTDTIRVTSNATYSTDRSTVRLTLQHGETRAEEALRHSVNGARVQQALSGACRVACVPLDLLGAPGSITPEMLAYIAAEAKTTGNSALSAIALEGDWRFRRTGIELSTGIEFRRESLDVKPDLILQQGELIGGGNLGVAKGDRDVVELYAEAYLPIVRSAHAADRLSAQIAARASEYNDFGRVINPRLVLNWRPLSFMTLRGSIGRGFRAPSLVQLHAAEKQSFQQLNDPCTIASNIATHAGCTRVADPSLTQFLTVTGGNTSLSAERSESAIVGAHARFPWRNHEWAFSIDWYNINQKDVVESSAQYILNQNARTSAFAPRVERDSNGNISRINATLQNIGRRDIRGYDFAATGRFFLPRLGYVTLALNATHIDSFRDKFDPDTATVEKAGTFSDEASGGLGGLPDWKVSIGMNLEMTHWQAAYNIYHVSSLREVIPLSDRTRTISSWTTHNLNTSYLGPASAWVRVTLGLNNLFDASPPFSAAAFNDSYDGRTYDITGRYLYLRFDKSI